MNYRETRCTGSISNLVECAWSVQMHQAEAIVHPDGYADLLLDASGGLHLSGAASQSRALQSCCGSVLHGFRLKSGSIPFLFNAPASALANQVVSVAQLSSPTARALTSIARQSDSQDQLIQAVFNLLSQECTGWTPDRRITLVLSQLHARSLPSIASAVGITERQLRRLFLQEVGISPSRLRRVHRLQHLIDAMRLPRPNRPMATLALDHGFCDQAHMNHELKELTGMTPSALYRSVANR